MKGLLNDAGKYRKQSVGIIKGSKLKHLAPSFGNVSYLMKDLFNYLKKDTEIILIKSCVFHYEMEFIHPFMDGNGRLGRLASRDLKLGVENGLLKKSGDKKLTIYKVKGK